MRYKKLHWQKMRHRQEKKGKEEEEAKEEEEEEAGSTRGCTTLTHPMRV